MSPCISPSRRTKARSANWSASPPATRSRKHIAFDTVEAKDWVKATLEELVPVRAGRFVVHGQHDRAKVPPNKLGIEIEAALAFGTGHHGTTRGCLLLLDEVLKAYRPRRVLDLGTGTGVLGHRRGEGAADKCAGERHRSARRCAWRAENARLNGTGDLVETIRATGFSAPQFAERGPFDLVLANILANPLRQMATPMARHLAPSALVILSGLLPHQAQSVVAAYRARGLVLMRHLRIEGWSSLLMRKRGEGSIRRSALAAGDHAFFLAQAALDARLDEPIQNLDDDPALLLVDGQNWVAANRRRIFSNVKAGIVHPLVVELKHSWNSPRYRWKNCRDSKSFHPV